MEKLIPTWCLVYALLVLFLREGEAKSNIVLRNDGGYSNIVVALPTEANDGEIDAFITNIYDSFKAMSTLIPNAFATAKDSYYVGNVSILLPSNYAGNYSKQIHPATFEWMEDADILAQKAGIWTDIRTQQTGDCGDPGDVINVPLTDWTDPSGKKLLREFVKYRYGVFDEGDEEATLHFTGHKGQLFQPNACVNNPVVGNITNTNPSKDSCNHTEKDIWLPSSCYLNLTGLDNSGVTSSLMFESAVDLRDMTKFCDDKSHDPQVATEHNRRCSGQSVMAVIKKHSDFPGGALRTAGTEHNVTFNYVQRKQSVVFVIDNHMDDNSILKKTVLRTLHRYINKDNAYFQANTQLGFYNTVQSPSTTPPMNYPIAIGHKSIPDAETFIKNFNTQPSADSCLVCALDSAISDMAKNQSTGIIVIVAGDKLDIGKENNFTDILELLEKNHTGIRVWSVSLNSTLFEKELLQLANTTSGKVYDASSDISVDPFYASWHMEEAIHDVINSVSRNIVQIHRQVMNPTNGDYSASFEVGDYSAAGGDVYLNLDCEDCGGEINSIAIKYTDDASPVNTLDTNSSKTPSDTKFLISITKEPASGVPHPALVAIFDYKKPANFYLSVVGSRKSTDPKNLPIFLKTKLQMTNKTIPNSVYYKSPPRIFAQVMQDSNPIEGADVKAVVTGEDGTTFTVTLDCSGYPDWTYSAHLLNLDKVQRYRIDVTALGTGKSYVVNKVKSPSDATESGVVTALYRDKTIYYKRTKSYSFKRIDDSNQLFLWNNNDVRHYYYPGQINDLVLTDVQKNETWANVTLAWTAPGMELDFGIVDGYNIRYSYNLDSFKKSMNSADTMPVTLAEGQTLTPHVAGSRETVTLLFRTEDPRSIYVAIQSFLYSSKHYDIPQDLISIQSYVLTLQLVVKPTPSTSGGGLSAGAVIGIVILVLAILAAGIYVTCRFLRYRRRGGILEDTTFPN